MSAMTATREEMLAFAVYEMRLLLADHLGSDSQSPMSVRIAAHLAYALHNDAQAVLEGRPSNAEHAERRIKAIDGILGTNLVNRMAAFVACKI